MFARLMIILNTYNYEKILWDDASAGLFGLQPTG
jgi:hypothetical protein